MKFQNRQYSLDERRLGLCSFAHIRSLDALHSGIFLFPPLTPLDFRKVGDISMFITATNLWESAKENVGFLLVSAIIIAAIFFFAYQAENWMNRNKKENQKVDLSKRLAFIGMFSAISTVLMLFELPLWFAPGFYKLDFSEIPVLICSFAMGPVAGIFVELCKVLLKLVIKGTSTAFVGDFANFVIGSTLILPAAIIYQFRKTKKGAIIGVIVGTLVMTVFGSAFNAVYLLPKFAQLYGMSLDAIIQMGTAVNPSITNVSTLVLFAVVPMNLLKGVLDSIVVVLIYKYISRVMHRTFSNR